MRERWKATPKKWDELFKVMGYTDGLQPTAATRHPMVISVHCTAKVMRRHLMQPLSCTGSPLEFEEDSFLLGVVKHSWLNPEPPFPRPIPASHHLSHQTLQFLPDRCQHL